MHQVETILAIKETRGFTPSERLSDEAVKQIEAAVAEGNIVGGMSMQLIQRDDRAFAKGAAKKLGFSGVNNYVSVIAKNEKDEVYEKAGYYGTFVTLAAAKAGLAAAWSDGTNSTIFTRGFKEGKEKKVAAIAIGTPADPADAPSIALPELPEGWYQDEASGWVIDPATNVFYERTTLRAFDPTKNLLVDMQTGKYYSMENPNREVVEGGLANDEASVKEWFDQCVEVAMKAPSKDGARPSFTLEGTNVEGLPLVRCTPAKADDKDAMLDMGKAEAYFEVAAASAGRAFAWAHETPIVRSAGATYGHRFRSKITPAEFNV